MRIYNEKVDVNYDDTKKFFNNRKEVYDDKNPYVTTMYQDNNKELVEKRNEYEIRKILPKLGMNDNSIVIDIACGVGRWCDAIQMPVKNYFGLDFSEGLIDIARQRNISKPNCKFAISEATEISNCILQNGWNTQFNKVLIVGILVYLNDGDIKRLLESLQPFLHKECTIYIREPVGIQDRLSLKNFYSDELSSEYNAIYRTQKEYEEDFWAHLELNGFKIIEKDLLFSEDRQLNNRKETAQYYWILKR